MHLRPERYWLTGALLLVSALVAAADVAPLRLPEIEARGDAVVLVADARTGRMLGGAGLAGAHARAYAPGSVFKLAIALAAIESGELDPGLTHRCTGSEVIGRRRYRCWTKAGHGSLDFREALAGSCNLYFVHLARGLSRAAILRSARRLGMLSTAGSDAELTDSTLLGDAFTASPAELLQTALVLASRGRLGPPGSPLAGPAYRPLFDGLSRCARTGTAREAWNRRFPPAGKTGTTALPGVPGATVGWFIGYAPASNPRYAIVVMRRHARGSDAAALAGQVLRRLR